MDSPGPTENEEKEGPLVRKENRARKESEASLVPLERRANHPMMSLLRVLLVLQDLLGSWALLDLRALRGLPE